MNCGNWTWSSVRVLLALNHISRPPAPFFSIEYVLCSQLISLGCHWFSPVSFLLRLLHPSVMGGAVLWRQDLSLLYTPLDVAITSPEHCKNANEKKGRELAAIVRYQGKCLQPSSHLWEWVWTVTSKQTWQILNQIQLALIHEEREVFPFGL